MNTISPEMESLKARLKATWMAGDYGLIAKSIEPCAEEFVTRLALKSGTRLLDVACGNGNVAIPAARAKAAVTGVDIAVNLLEQTRARAESEGLVIQFDNGDAERQQKNAALPPGKRYVALPRECKSIEEWQREFNEEAEKQRASEIDFEHPHLTLMRGNKNA